MKEQLMAELNVISAHTNNICAWAQLQYFRFFVISVVIKSVKDNKKLSITAAVTYTARAVTDH